jgi:hypothetical protein
VNEWGIAVKTKRLICSNFGLHSRCKSLQWGCRCLYAGGRLINIADQDGEMGVVVSACADFFVVFPKFILLEIFYIAFIWYICT